MRGIRGWTRMPGMPHRSHFKHACVVWEVRAGSVVGFFEARSPCTHGSPRSAHWHGRPGRRGRCSSSSAVGRCAIVTKRTPPISNRCKPSAKLRTPKPRKKPFCLRNSLKPNGETYNPAPDLPSAGTAGEFVYSAPEIKRLIGRDSRLSDAKILFAAA
jgi:hypothetical protein